MADELAELLRMVPAGVEGGDLTFAQGDLHSTLSIWKDRHDRSVFGWMVHTYDTGLRDRMESFGGMSIRIDHPTPSGDANPTNIPTGACYGWPASGTPLAPEVTAAVTQYGPLSLCFVRDRHDLGLLLLADAHVHRGSVWSFAPTNNEPARLAQALLLARHSGDQDLERAAVAKLRNRGEEPVAPRPDYLFRHAVADWAKQYSKATGIDLSDLAPLKRKRPRYPEVPEPQGS
ncbi:hypothetical protein EJ357_47230 [Streptomyces cyaneochromogenes]|uniref:Uncharacterized protein n=1 Tax=Streptomyces cyaneochromogenes TaxID=2496836 RepID=A0A3S9MLP2_9ACTN|nr:hypothetical protein [Streptomyces cyaneochromogenes]AZQ40047.1 hypothetical protein EJ357_47230 [Streptomyces cyaneochromogenes]